MNNITHELSKYRLGKSSVFIIAGLLFFSIFNLLFSTKLDQLISTGYSASTNSAVASRLVEAPPANSNQVANFASSLAATVPVNDAKSCGLFCKYTEYSVDGDRIQSVVSADFNNDGRIDLATANESSNTISVMLADGARDVTFGKPTSYPVGAGPYKIISADFNRDGKMDLAVTNHHNTNISVLLGNGTGGFGTSLAYGIGNGASDNPIDIASADFNRDGKMDLAVTSDLSGISMLLGNGAGGFDAAIVHVCDEASPYGITTADFNNDGKMDLATANEITGNISVLLGDGAGGLDEAKIYFAGTKPYFITTADFNRDGKMDLAVTNNVSSNVSILIGKGNGEFGASSSYNVGEIPESIISVDFNRDGKMDLATANQNSNNISILLGNGNGRFGTARNYVSGSGDQPHGIASADFNRDGKMDLMIGNMFNNTVSILLNSPLPPIIGNNNPQDSRI